MTNSVTDHGTLSDASLILAVRQGDSDAYGELYRRHLPAAVAAGRALSRSRNDADDIASESFARVLKTLQSGGGPEVSFRPYLLSTVRNAFYDRTRRSREDASDSVAEAPHGESLRVAEVFEDAGMAGAAFASLPERWQLVLWHSEVEGRSAAEIAPLIGLAPNAVSALTYRAREGLRQAFLQQHLSEQRKAECRQCAAQLGPYVRDGLSARDRRAVQEHLDRCPTCPGLVAELQVANSGLRAALIPAVVGVPVAAYLSGLGGSGMFGWLIQLSPKQQAAAGGGTAAAAAVALLLLLSGGDKAAVAVTPTTSPPAVTTVPATAPEATQPDPITVPPPPPQTAPPSVPPPTTSPPTTPAPPVVVPPRTTPPAPPSTLAPPTANVAVGVDQLSSVVPGGRVAVRVRFTNQGPATGPLTLSIQLPTGVTFAGTAGGPISCVAGVTCTITGLGVGQQLSTTIELNVAGSATGTLALTSRVTSPTAAAAVSSSGVKIADVRDLSYFSVGRGQVVTAGASSMTCSPSPGCTAAQNGNGAVPDRNDHSMQFVNVAGGTFNSSSADVVFGGTADLAYLTWSGDVSQGAASAPNAALSGQVTLTGPSGTSTVTASRVVQLGGGRYVAIADVTGLVAGSGTYSVADIQSAEDVGSFAGWSLMIATNDASQPQRVLAIVDPLEQLVANDSYSVSLPLVETLSSSPVRLHVVAFEGDISDTGERIRIGASAVATNQFVATTPGPRNPAQANTFGVDVLAAVGTASGNSVTANIAAGNDPVTLSLVAVVVDLP